MNELRHLGPIRGGAFLAGHRQWQWLGRPYLSITLTRICLTFIGLCDTQTRRETSLGFKYRIVDRSPTERAKNRYQGCCSPNIPVPKRSANCAQEGENSVLSSWDGITWPSHVASNIDREDVNSATKWLWTLACHHCESWRITVKRHTIDTKYRDTVCLELELQTRT
jgi:hypothetical protein